MKKKKLLWVLVLIFVCATIAAVHIELSKKPKIVIQGTYGNSYSPETVENGHYIVLHKDGKAESYVQNRDLQKGSFTILENTGDYPILELNMEGENRMLLIFKEDSFLLVDEDNVVKLYDKLADYSMYIGIKGLD